MGYTEEQQARARAAYEEARRASEQALSQAAMLRAEQERTTTQISEVLASRADETQRQLEGTTQWQRSKRFRRWQARLPNQKELHCSKQIWHVEAQAQLEEELDKEDEERAAKCFCNSATGADYCSTSAQTYVSYEKQMGGVEGTDDMSGGTIGATAQEEHNFGKSTVRCTR